MASLNTESLNLAAVKLTTVNQPMFQKTLTKKSATALNSAGDNQCICTVR